VVTEIDDGCRFEVKLPEINNSNVLNTLGPRAEAYKEAVHNEKEKLELTWPLSDIMFVVFSTGAIG
jgi:hypothetical protein